MRRWLAVLLLAAWPAYANEYIPPGGSAAVSTATPAPTATPASTATPQPTATPIDNPLVVGKGGTGATTLTNHGVVLGQATSAVAVTSAGTSGQVLTSNGASADPTFQAAAGGISGLTTNTLTKAASATTIANSSITDDGTNTLVTTILNQGTAAGAANAVSIGETAGQITFEGATADTIETRILVADPTVGDQSWTIPDVGAVASRTFASLEGTQIFTGSKTFNAGFELAIGQVFSIASNTAALVLRTQLTPDSLLVGTNALGNSLHIEEYLDNVYDFNNGPCGTSACTDPALIVHSHNQSTTQYVSAQHDGTNGVVKVGAGGLSLPAHFTGTGTAPAVSACGTSPSTVAGSDTAGRLTTGSGGTVQSCTLTFAVAYAVAPACMVNDESAILAVRAVATTTTLVLDSAVAGTLASSVLTYVCHGL